MEKTTTRKFKWFWAWQDEAEEAWLQELSQQGRHLSSVGNPTVYDFESGEPADFVYRLDYRSHFKMNKENYLQLFRDVSLALFPQGCQTRRGTGNLHGCGIKNQQVPALAGLPGDIDAALVHGTDHYARAVPAFYHYPNIYPQYLCPHPDLDQDQSIKKNLTPTGVRGESQLV